MRESRGARRRDGRNGGGRAIARPRPHAAHLGRHAHAAGRGRRSSVSRAAFPARHVRPRCAGPDPSACRREALSVRHARRLFRGTVGGFEAIARPAGRHLQRGPGRSVHRATRRGGRGATVFVGRRREGRARADAVARSLPRARSALRPARRGMSLSWPVAGAVLFGALLHASWNALVKSSTDKALDTAVIHVIGSFVALPFAILLGLPARESW